MLGVGEGSVKQFTSPDDLHLDPASAVIAVNVFGNEGDELEVNGVVFLGDQTNDTDVGLAEQGDVSVSTFAANQIPDWAFAPEFTGGQGNSASNLAEVMESIRWNGAPNPVSIEIEGLVPGVPYEIQLLFDEGRDRVRMWDITVEDELVVDNITSAGNFPDDFWDADNSAVYTGEFPGPADGTLNIEMAQDLGGESPEGDNNPILQGIIVHVGDTTDTDEDGMPDLYEEANGLDPEVNDADGDKDEDGISNLEEFENGTKPNSDDTDGDGLKDGVENGSGTFVSNEMTGTSPTWSFS